MKTKLQGFTKYLQTQTTLNHNHMQKRHNQPRFQAFHVKSCNEPELHTLSKLFFFRFGRHRVIIRKGHVGRRFYIIYSGTVAFTLSEDDCAVFSKPTQCYHLGKGDAFGVRSSGSTYVVSLF